MTRGLFTLCGLVARSLADDGNVTDSRRFHAKVGVAMIVQAAFATRLAAAPRREGTLRKMTLGPIAKSLPEQLKTA